MRFHWVGELGHPQPQEFPVRRGVHDREPGPDALFIRPGDAQGIRVIRLQIRAPGVHHVDPWFSRGPRGPDLFPALPALLVPAENGDPLLQHDVDLVPPGQ